MRVLQINVVANSGSTGRIAEGIGIKAQKAGFDSWIAYGRFANTSSSHLLRIGSNFEIYEHVFETRVFDNHGLASRHGTALFLRKLEKIKPDLIHLHNIHGYYINYKILFQYLKKMDLPVVWTLHDCWSFTGHCSHFITCGCERWKTGCFNCPLKKSYPSSFFLDRSSRNYSLKKELFSSISNLTIVSVSKWLDDLVAYSFFKDSNHTCIHNGINTDIFSPHFEENDIRTMYGIRANDILLLGVAGAWFKKKGLFDFIELSKLLPPHHIIVLIGLSEQQVKSLPDNIIGIQRTESSLQLAQLYSASDLFLNLTYEDNYPSVNLEAISCGTPCLTYRTGGCPESITPETGFVVPQGQLGDVLKCIEMVRVNGKQSYSSSCRNYALTHFRQEDRFQDYINLYNQILHK